MSSKIQQALHPSDYYKIFLSEVGPYLNEQISLFRGLDRMADLFTSTARLLSQKVCNTHPSWSILWMQFVSSNCTDIFLVLYKWEQLNGVIICKSQIATAKPWSRPFDPVGVVTSAIGSAMCRVGETTVGGERKVLGGI